MRRNAVQNVSASEGPTSSAVVAASVASLLVRELWGYSFATWRFHLRGDDTIRGPQDVGWVRQISAAAMMRRDYKSASVDLPIGKALELMSAGREKQLVLQLGGSYAGLVLTADLNVASDAEQPVETLARQQDAMLRPGMTISQVIQVFADTETDVLAVVESEGSKRVLGTLTEAHVLRKYGEELERRNRELVFG